MSALANLRIEAVTCSGNVFQKNAAVKKFAEDAKTKVMVISTQHAASGTNLMQASYVFILDPIITSN